MKFVGAARGLLTKQVAHAMAVRMVLVLLLLILLVPVCGSAQEPLTQVEAVVDRVKRTLSEEFAASTPLPSASAGVTYTFDEASGTFSREPATFGQIYLDRADPLGRRRINVSLAYQYAALSKIEGKDSGDLEDPLPIAIDDLLTAIEIPHYSIDASVHSLLLSASYGITDDLEASIALPVVFSHLHTDRDVGVAFVPKGGSLVSFEDKASQTDDHAGIGDVMLRAKYRLLAREQTHVSAGLLLRLPAGDTRQLAGLGFVEVAPSLIASTRRYDLRSWARLQAHVNTVLAFNTDDVDDSEGRWGVGLDWGLGDSVTAALAFLGRHPFSRIGPAGSFEFTRCQSDLASCATNPELRTGTAPVFGISGDRADSFTAAIGARGALWRDTLFGFVNLAVPLNDAFLRMHPIPLVGLEATF